MVSPMAKGFNAAILAGTPLTTPDPCNMASGKQEMGIGGFRVKIGKGRFLGLGNGA